MNAFGEPNMGNPSVRFDEGRERVGHWPLAFQSHPLLPTLQVRLGLFLLIEGNRIFRMASDELPQVGPAGLILCQ